MSQTVVTATTDRELGSRPSRRLRAEGKLPAVVYGLDKEPQPIAVDYIDLRDALKTDAGMNTVLTLDIEGGDTETVIIRSVERDPIKRVVTHADFLRIDLSRKVRVSVPIVLVGDGSAVTSNGGMIEQKLFEIEVEVSPDAIPAEFEADMSMMTLDRRISVADLDLGEATTMMGDDVSVVTPVVSRAAKMAANDEDIEADEAAEGEDDGDEE
ncbi:MAG: 50S ribosomal protein L25 [Actinomycetota bacterium]